ncbi:MAG: ABC transporter permease subunit [Saprospiraceae bacterium]|nr:ABC transporter permease subunit [Saprospiraceae bacterium]
MAFMVYYLRLEWLKFRKNGVFQMMVLVYSILLPLILLAVKSMNISVPGLSPRMVVEFPTIWSFLAYSGSWLAYFFLGFLAIYIFSSEFSQRTFRQNIISGLTREELFLSKIGFLLVISFLASLYYLICVLVMGYLYTPAEKLAGVFDRSSHFLRYWLMCSGYMSLAILITVVIRRTAASVFIYFAYTIFIEPMIRWFFHKGFADNRSMHFYPANAFEDLTPLPLGDVSITKDLVESGDLDIYLTPLEASLTSVIYILLFVMASYYLIKTKDL